MHAYYKNILRPTKYRIPKFYYFFLSLSLYIVFSNNVIVKRIICYNTASIVDVQRCKRALRETIFFSSSCHVEERKKKVDRYYIQYYRIDNAFPNCHEQKAKLNKDRPRGKCAYVGRLRASRVKGSARTAREKNKLIKDYIVNSKFRPTNFDVVYIRKILLILNLKKKKNFSYYYRYFFFKLTL